MIQLTIIYYENNNYLFIKNSHKQINLSPPPPLSLVYLSKLIFIVYHYSLLLSRDTKFFILKLNNISVSIVGCRNSNGSQILLSDQDYLNRK